MKEVKIMKNQKKFAKAIIENVVEKSLKRDANSTTCMAIYQPKAPAALKKFSKLEK